MTIENVMMAVAFVVIVIRRAILTPRIASPGMLLEKFPPMIGAALPNRLGGAHGRNHQHGRASRDFVSGGGTLPVGRAAGEGTHPRRVVPDDGLVSQACGAGGAATRPPR